MTIFDALYIMSCRLFLRISELRDYNVRHGLLYAPSPVVFVFIVASDYQMSITAASFEWLFLKHQFLCPISFITSDLYARSRTTSTDLHNMEDICKVRNILRLSQDTLELVHNTAFCQVFWDFQFEIPQAYFAFCWSDLIHCSKNTILSGSHLALVRAWFQTLGTEIFQAKAFFVWLVFGSSTRHSESIVAVRLLIFVWICLWHYYSSARPSWIGYCSKWASSRAVSGKRWRGQKTTWDGTYLRHISEIGSFVLERVRFLYK